MPVMIATMVPRRSLGGLVQGISDIGVIAILFVG